MEKITYMYEAYYHYNIVDNIFDKITLHERDANDMLNTT